jgi:hypothetical protein
VAELEPTRLRPSRLPSLAECEEWVGWRVDDINGSMMGQVEKLCLDETGSPAWIVVSEFRLGEGRRFVIPVADAVGCGGRVWSPHPRQQIRMSARIAGPLISPQADRRLRSHYASERRAA